MGFLFLAMFFLDTLPQPQEWLPAATWLSLTLAPTLLLVSRVLPQAALATPRARNRRG